jgi:hypothetical protein
MARQRRYREVAIGLVTAIVVTLASLLVFDWNPLRAYQRISGKSDFFEQYIVAMRSMEESKGDHSLLQTMKTIARVIRNHGLHFSHDEYLLHPSDPLAWKLYHTCLLLTAIIGLIVLWKVWNKPVLNQIFALASVTMVLPFVAGDYTLTLILIPLGFFLIFLLQDVASGKTSLSLRQILWFLLPCAIVTGIEPLWVLHGVIKCIALLVLLGASTAIELPSTLFGELPLGDRGTAVRAAVPA